MTIKRFESFNIKENINSKNDEIGLNLRSLLDGELAMALKKYDLGVYDERNSFIDELEKRISEYEWISLSNGTTFEKTFTPKK